MAQFPQHSHASMAIYLSTGMLRELSHRLISGGYAKDTPAALVYKATWPEEEAYICTVETLAQVAEEHGIIKTALVLVGDHSGRADPAVHRRPAPPHLHEEVISPFPFQIRR